MGFLFQLDITCLILEGTHLTEREARWASWLHALLVGMSSYQELAIVRMYAARERAANALGQPRAFTDDLDAYLQWRPWLSEDLAHLYEVMIDEGLIPALPSYEDLSKDIKEARPDLPYPQEILALIVAVYSEAGYRAMFGKPPEHWYLPPGALDTFGDDEIGGVELAIRYHRLRNSPEFQRLGTSERLHTLNELATTIVEGRKAIEKGGCMRQSEEQEGDLDK